MDLNKHNTNILFNVHVGCYKQKVTCPIFGDRVAGKGFKNKTSTSCNMQTSFVREEVLKPKGTQEGSFSNSLSHIDIS